MIRRPSRSTRTDTLFPYTTLFRSLGFAMKLGREFGVPLELAGLVDQTFVRARQQYGGAAWSTMVVKLLEDALATDLRARSEEHTSELQSLMRISYAVFCLKQKIIITNYDIIATDDTRGALPN